VTWWQTSSGKPGIALPRLPLHEVLPYGSGQRVQRTFSIIGTESGACHKKEGIRVALEVFDSLCTCRRSIPVFAV
jgi:hypothetical protein